MIGLAKYQEMMTKRRSKENFGNISRKQLDKYHLHMLVFKNINKNSRKETSNYTTSIIINSVYLILIIPAFFLKEEALFCKIWFSLILII